MTRSIEELLLVIEKRREIRKKDTKFCFCYVSLKKAVEEVLENRKRHDPGQCVVLRVMRRAER